MNFHEFSRFLSFGLFDACTWEVTFLTNKLHNEATNTMSAVSATSMWGNIFETQGAARPQAINFGAFIAEDDLMEAAAAATTTSPSDRTEPVPSLASQTSFQGLFDGGESRTLSCDFLISGLQRTQSATTPRTPPTQPTTPSTTRSTITTASPAPAVAATPAVSAPAFDEDAARRCYNTYTVPQLRCLLRDRHLFVSGVKQVLVQRLVQADASADFDGSSGSSNVAAQRPSKRKRAVRPVVKLEKRPSVLEFIGPKPQSKARRKPARPVTSNKKKKYSKRVLAQDERFRLGAFLLSSLSWHIRTVTERINLNPEDPRQLRQYCREYSREGDAKHHLWQQLNIKDGVIPRGARHYGLDVELLEKYPHLILEKCKCHAKRRDDCMCACIPLERVEGQTWVGGNGEYKCEQVHQCHCPGRRGFFEQVKKVGGRVTRRQKPRRARKKAVKGMVVVKVTARRTKTAAI